MSRIEEPSHEPDIARLKSIPDFQGLFKGVNSREEAIERLSWIVGSEAFELRRRRNAAIELARLAWVKALPILVSIHRSSNPADFAATAASLRRNEKPLVDTAVELLLSIIEEHQAAMSDDQLLSITNGARPNYRGGPLNPFTISDDRARPPGYRLLKLVDQEGDRRGLWDRGEFDVILTSAGSAKLEVLKEVRALTGLGLREAKELVDGAPRPVLEHIKSEPAQRAKERLVRAGATVEVQG